MSKRTNNFSGDLLLLAIASPKLRSTATLFAVTSAKHWSLRESTPSNIWPQTFFSPENSNLTCYKHDEMAGLRENTYTHTHTHTHTNNPIQFLVNPYSNPHEMNPISNLSLQNFPLHLLDIIFSKFFHT